MIRAFSSVSKRLSTPFLHLGIVCTCLLSGCSSLPAPKPLPHTAQEAALIPPDTILTMNDGARIPVRLYRPNAEQPPQAVILALHGFGDSRDAWETLAPSLTTHHLLIVAPDLRGFGQAPKAPATAERQVGDVTAELLWIHHHWPHTPVFLMGESMGGAIALLTSAQTHTAQKPLMAGTILLAPAIMDIGQPWRAVLSTWRFFTPQMTLDGRAAPGRPRIATDNLPALRRMYFDPLTQHSSTIQALDSLVRVMHRAWEKRRLVQGPVLVITGTNDQFVPPLATAHVFQSLPPSARRDVIAGGHHLLSRDRRAVDADIRSWIFSPDRFLPSGGDIRAIEWADLITD